MKQPYTNDRVPYYLQCLNSEFHRRQAIYGKYSLRAFARSIGIAPSMLCSLMAGQSIPSKRTIQKVAKELKFSQEELQRFIDSIISEMRSIFIHTCSNYSNNA